MQRSIYLLFLLVLAGGLAGAATVSYYDDFSGFQSALTAYTLVDFEHTVFLNGFLILDTPTGAQFLAVNSTNANGAVVTTANAGVGSGLSLKIPNTVPEPDAYVQITLPSTVNALGFWVRFRQWNNGYVYASSTMTVSVAGTAQSAVSLPSDRAVWVGYVSDTSFDTLTLFAPNGAASIDNLEFGNATLAETEAPEIATLMMIGTGLLLIRFRIRRPHHAAHGPISFS